MKKLIFFIAIVIIGTVETNAQYWQIPNPNANANPGNLNTDNEYPVGTGLPVSWTTILTPFTIPTWSATNTIPFVFSFNGTPVNSFKVSNSGILTFDITTALPAPGFTAMTLTNATIPDNSVCISGLGGIGTNDNVVIKTFGTAPNRQLWVFFTSYGYGSTTASDGTNYCYWSIVLEETTNRIHIVDQRTNGFAGNNHVSAGIKINASSTFMVAGSPNLITLAGTDFTPADNTYYTFIPGVQSQFDMALIANTMSPIQALSLAPFMVQGIVRNEGYATIHDFTINYRINGGAIVSANITGVNILPLQSYNFSHPTLWQPAAIGVYYVVSFASNINGNIDQNISNDENITSINVVQQLVQRIPLFEKFTSSMAVPCATSNSILDPLLNANPNKFTCVKYQQDFPGTGDIYANTDGITRRSFYSITSIPCLYVDGVYWTSNIYTQIKFDSAYFKPSFINISSVFNRIGNTFNISTTITPFTNYTGNINAFIAIVEDPTMNNAGSNEETIFHYVEQKMVPDWSGQPLTNINVGTPINLSNSYTFPAINNVEDFSHLKVAVWVQNIDTKEVYQSAYAIDSTMGPVSIDAITKYSFSITPNPAKEQVAVSSEKFIKEIKIYNMPGTLVFKEMMNDQTKTIDISALAKGVYIVEVVGNDYKVYRKLAVE